MSRWFNIFDTINQLFNSQNVIIKIINIFYNLKSVNLSIKRFLMRIYKATVVTHSETCMDAWLRHSQISRYLFQKLISLKQKTNKKIVLHIFFFIIWIYEKYISCTSEWPQSLKRILTKMKKIIYIFQNCARVRALKWKNIFLDTKVKVCELPPKIRYEKCIFT